MSVLELQYDLSQGTSGGKGAVVAQVLDRQLKIRGEAVLTSRSPSAKVEVEPGAYFIVVSRASGKTFEIEVEVKPGAGPPVVLRPSQERASPHEWLAYQSSLGTLRTASRPTSGPEANRPKRAVWLRIWETAGPGKPWTPQAPNFEEKIVADGYGKLALAGQPGRIRYLQYGGAEVPWCLVLLPPVGYRIEVVFCGAEDLSEANRGASAVEPGQGLRCIVTSEDETSETLLRALTSARPEAARSLGGLLGEKEPTAVAATLLHDKVVDPVAAAVGGYFLLRYGGAGRMRDWPMNLANMFPWLPDGPVIHAWQLMSGEPNRRDLSQARARLIEAVGRGMPIFTEGLRRLRDGLSFFLKVAGRGPSNVYGQQRSELRESQEDPATRTALLKLQDYLAAADWDAAHTTFLGRSPETPSPEPVTGWPEPGGGLETVEIPGS